MKNYLSYSAVSKYLMCAKAYYLYYLRGIREKYITSALLFGSAFDEGLNVLLNPNQLEDSYVQHSHEVFDKIMTTQKVNSKEVNLETYPFINYSNEDFDADILTNEDIILIKKGKDATDLPNLHEEFLAKKKARTLKGSDYISFNYMSYISLKRKGHLFLDAYNEQIIPLIDKVIAVQKEVNLENSNGDKFVVKIDLIVKLKDGRYVIFDNKTSAQPYKTDQAHNSKQLASYYGVLLETDFFKENDINLKNLYVGYFTIVKKIRKKKEPKVNIQVIINSVNLELVEEVFEEYDKVNQLIHDGVFTARPETCKSQSFGKCFCSLTENQRVDISVDWRRK